MKKFLLLPFLLASLMLFSQEITTNDYHVKTSWSDFKLKGKIEKITTTAFNTEGETVTLPFLENEFYNQYIIEFDKNGLFLKQTNYLDYSGKLAIYSFTENNYDNKHLIYQQKTTVLNNGEDPLRISSLKEFSYNQKGNLIALKEILKGKNSTANYLTDFFYENKLNHITIKSDDQLLSENKLVYNKNGQLIKEETITFDGKKGQSKFFIYDNQTPIYLEENTKGKKQITFVAINPNNTKYQQFDHNHQLKIELVKDINNQIIAAKKQTFVNGKPILTNYTLQYTYDAIGNWITCEVKTNDNTKYTIKRNIIYYN